MLVLNRLSFSCMILFCITCVGCHTAPKPARGMVGFVLGVTEAEIIPSLISAQKSWGLSDFAPPFDRPPICPPPDICDSVSIVISLPNGDRVGQIEYRWRDGQFTSLKLDLRQVPGNTSKMTFARRAKGTRVKLADGLRNYVRTIYRQLVRQNRRRIMRPETHPAIIEHAYRVDAGLDIAVNVKVEQGAEGLTVVSEVAQSYSRK